MSIVGIFTQKQTQIGDLYFDATLSEATQLSTTVTQFPVEAGFTGTDHSVQEPLRITMRVAVTDNIFTGIGDAIGSGTSDAFGNLAGGALGTATGAAIGQLGGTAASAAGFGFENLSAAYQAGRAQTRSQAALEQLRQLQRRGLPVNVATLKKSYKNCLITDTRQETNKENENAIEIVVEMVELVTVGINQTGAVELPVNDPAGTQGQDTNQLGLLTPL